MGKTIGQALKESLGLDATNQVTLPCRDCPTEVSISRWAMETVLAGLKAKRLGPMTRNDHPRCDACLSAWRERLRQREEQRDAQETERRREETARRAKERPRHGDYEP